MCDFSMQNRRTQWALVATEHINSKFVPASWLSHFTFPVSISNRIAPRLHQSAAGWASKRPHNSEEINNMNMYIVTKRRTVHTHDINILTSVLCKCSIQVYTIIVYNVMPWFMRISTLVALPFAILKGYESLAGTAVGVWKINLQNVYALPNFVRPCVNCTQQHVHHESITHGRLYLDILNSILWDSEGERQQGGSNSQEQASQPTSGYYLWSMLHTKLMCMKFVPEKGYIIPDKQYLPYGCL